MKKIVGILAVAALFATSVFAVDISARVVQKGSIAGGVEDGDTYFLGIGKTHQKDGDLVEFSSSTDNAGASFRLWADFDNDEPVKVRYLSFWFKPIDMLKITIGRSAPGLFTEKIDWWKIGTGVHIEDYNGWGGPGRYSSAVIGDGYGVNFELKPIDGLTVGAQFIPGAGKAFFTKPNSGDATYAAWGVMAKYQVTDAISAGAAYRDNGKDSWKQARFGIGYNGAFEGWLCGTMLMNEKAKDSGLDAVVIDNYFSMGLGFMNLQARVPVTIRIADKEGSVKGYYKDANGQDQPYFWGKDSSYLVYNIKASFPQDGWTPYVQIQSIDLDDDGTYNACGTMHQAIRLDDFKFNTSIHLGASFNVGAVGLDVAGVVNIDTADGAKMGWYIPFIASMSL